MSRRRCYQPFEWELVESSDPAFVSGIEIARRRVRSLPHDAAHQSLEYMLISAYLQGLTDGTLIAERGLLRVDPPAPTEEAIGL